MNDINTLQHNSAIGVFDSGLGGLTAVRALKRTAPNERVIYFGDTGRVPYGGRAPETIITYTKQALDFLRGFDTKAIIVACGTASAVALPVLAKADICTAAPVGVVDAACIHATQSTRNKQIGVIGTAATIGSGAYERTLRALDSSVAVTSVACPLFVPLVENGRIHKGDIVVETMVREYLEPLKLAGVDTLIMGCTHYPLLAAVIADVMGAGVTLVDAGEQAALATLALLRERDALSDIAGESRYFVSDSAPGFEKLASLFLGEDIVAETVML